MRYAASGLNRIGSIPSGGNASWQAFPVRDFNYKPVAESDENLALMRLIDEQYLRQPDCGSPRMTDWLRTQGHQINHKRVERLMQLMGLQAITPGPHTSVPNPEHPVFPYLLKGVAIVRKNQVWSADITYIPMQRGFLYLVAVIDWWSRFELAWELSNSMDSSFCVDALSKALRIFTPKAFKTGLFSKPVKPYLRKFPCISPNTPCF